MHSTRELWLASTVEALRPALREHAGLSVPRVRVSCGVPSRRRRGEVYIGATVDGVAEVILSLLHTAEASSVLGTLMRLCIYVATGSQAHGRGFQRIARQCGLVPPGGYMGDRWVPRCDCCALVGPFGPGAAGTVAGAAPSDRGPREEDAVALDHGGL